MARVSEKTGKSFFATRNSAKHSSSCNFRRNLFKVWSSCCRWTRSGPFGRFWTWFRWHVFHSRENVAKDSRRAKKVNIPAWIDSDRRADWIMAAELVGWSCYRVDPTKNQQDEEEWCPHRGVKAAIFWFDKRVSGLWRKFSGKLILLTTPCLVEPCPLADNTAVMVTSFMM